MGTRYRQLNNGPTILSIPSQVEGGKYALRSAIENQIPSQNTLAQHGRRILAHAGLEGVGDFMVLSGTDPNNSLSQHYPVRNHTRELIRTRARLMPGMRLRIDMIALPSGPCQKLWDEPYSAWMADSHSGKLRVSATFSAGIFTHTAVETIPVVGSQAQYGAEEPAFSSAGIRSFTLPINMPAAVEDNPVFGGEVDVEIVMEADGSLRLIDAVVYEEPYEQWRDDTHRENVNHIAVDAYPSQFAITGKALPDDARYGARQFLKTMNDQRLYWGAALVQWSAWDESTASITATASSGQEFTEQTFKQLAFPSLSAYNEADYPGWSMSSGGNSRVAEQADLLALRERNGCIPVTVRVYAKVTASGDEGIIRFQSATYSYTDLVVNSTTWGWYEGLAWLRCPLAGSLFSNLQISGRIVADKDVMSVRYVAVDFGGHFQLEE